MHLLKHIALTLVFLTALACGGSIPTTSPPTIDGNAADETVMLVRTHKYHVYCGAVRVGVRTLTTAAHCLRDADKNPLPIGTAVHYITHDGYRWGWQRHGSTIIARDDLRDVALLRTSLAFKSWASLRFDELEEGEPVCGMHHSLGDPYAFGCGTVVRVNKPALDLREYYTSIHIRPGASGSGLWDRYGRLSGVAVMYNLFTGWGYYVSIDPVVDLLQEIGA